MKINHRHFILIIFSLATLTLSILAYVFIYKKTIAQAEYYINATREVAGENEKKKLEQDSIKAYDVTKENRSKLPNYLAHESKVIDFIERIEKIGVDTKTTLELSAIENVGGKINAKIDIKGSWAGMMSALMLLENLPLASTIKDVHMRSSGEKEKEWNLLLNIEVLTMK